MKYKKGDFVRPILIAQRRGVILKTRVRKLRNVYTNLYLIRWANYDSNHWRQEQDICLVDQLSET